MWLGVPPVMDDIYFTRVRKKVQGRTTEMQISYSLSFIPRYADDTTLMAESEEEKAS